MSGRRRDDDSLQKSTSSVPSQTCRGQLWSRFPSALPLLASLILVIALQLVAIHAHSLTAPWAR